jgi:hypothetical protein
MLVRQYKEESNTKLPPIPGLKATTPVIDKKLSMSMLPSAPTQLSYQEKQSVSPFLSKQDHFGSTPLHFAAVNNHLGAVATLVIYRRRNESEVYALTLYSDM